MSKHTPGPWIISGKDDHWNLMTEDGCIIAVINGRRPAIIEDSYNARLIAAAPSMYDALWAIASMQITESTNKEEVLALCMSIAKIETQKLID